MKKLLMVWFQDAFSHRLFSTNPFGPLLKVTVFRWRCSSQAWDWWLKGIQGNHYKSAGIFSTGRSGLHTELWKIIFLFKQVIFRFYDLCQFSGVYLGWYKTTWDCTDSKSYDWRQIRGSSSTGMSQKLSTWFIEPKQVLLEEVEHI